MIKRMLSLSSYYVLVTEYGWMETIIYEGRELSKGDLKYYFSAFLNAL